MVIYLYAVRKSDRNIYKFEKNQGDEVKFKMKTVKKELFKIFRNKGINILWKDTDINNYIDEMLDVVNKRIDNHIKKCYKAKYITQEYSADHNDCDLCMAHGLEKLKREINKI